MRLESGRFLHPQESEGRFEEPHVPFDGGYYADGALNTSIIVLDVSNIPVRPSVVGVVGLSEN